MNSVVPVMANRSAPPEIASWSWGVMSAVVGEMGMICRSMPALA